MKIFCLAWKQINHHYISLVLIQVTHKTIIYLKKNYKKLSRTHRNNFLVRTPFSNASETASDGGGTWNALRSRVWAGLLLLLWFTDVVCNVGFPDGIGVPVGNPLFPVKNGLFFDESFNMFSRELILLPDEEEEDTVSLDDCWNGKGATDADDRRTQSVKAIKIEPIKINTHK